MFSWKKYQYTLVNKKKKRKLKKKLVGAMLNTHFSPQKWILAPIMAFKIVANNRPFYFSVKIRFDIACVNKQLTCNVKPYFLRKGCFFF